MAEHIRLGVNIDHVATVRNARGGAHPDPTTLALIAAQAGADGITAHLREDRRHIRDADIDRIRAEVGLPLNLEMAATPEMLAIALKVKPHASCLVPEKREERTTEGGLDVVGNKAQVAPIVKELGAAGVRVSLFVEPDEEALEHAALMGAAIVELHTGSWCEALATGQTERAAREFARLRAGATLAAGLGLEVHAGHGLDYGGAETIAALPEIAELNIGHFLIGEALSVGLPETIALMKAAMARGRRKAAA
ncbi:pyridoxine 5'-phosphate synthase [Hansschlegelia plantiphila]|uniref:Pyridoxine 5'-phosphate synthase n=1 Tax=Hansschlegelia plantiphila TaxID=374655 RepID=A0A9W6MV24_9HYPH|nr:pyridoxine 5'-phosphate synthase [Hansschlegelia plantiphila]GLK67498.1 pyridoxine 5'-phosphate synthase [Hansschlegelia plantiphila]